MSRTNLNLIAAACDNMGIGIKGTLPWKLKKEMSYFSRMTTKVMESDKINAVIMGRKTWEGIPEKYRPLSKRLNIVLTHHVEEVKEKVPDDVVVVSGLDEALEYLEERHNVENTWVIGGSSVYKAAMEHPNCDKIYLTEIQKAYECDTFFPNIDKSCYMQVKEEGVDNEEQCEDGIKYYFRVYKKL